MDNYKFSGDNNNLKSICPECGKSMSSYVFFYKSHIQILFVCKEFDCKLFSKEFSKTVDYESIFPVSEI